MSKKLFKEFGPSSWAIDHRTVIYVIMFIFLVLGISSYVQMPRESFPEINDTQIFVSTVFPGNTAEDMERLVSDPLEQELKGMSNLVEISSISTENFAIVIVQVDEDIPILEAKQKVTDLVDAVKSGADWPVFNNAKLEPNIFEMNFAEMMPVLNISMIGDYPIEELKEYAERLENAIENLQPIKEVNIRGIQEFEVSVAVDLYRMTSADVDFMDIINTISDENTTISAGNIEIDGQRRNVRIIGEIEQPEDLENFVVKTDNGAPVYLGDIATINFQETERKSYARSMGRKTVLLDVVKRGGENLIIAADDIKEIVANRDDLRIPRDIDITITNDTSTTTLNQVNDLINNIIFGVILVVTVLMFFIGFRNALFVGFAIPMSMFMAIMIMSFLGFTLNTMVLFGMVMGLGMLVDNGIVVVENVYRLMEKEGVSRIQAAKRGIGEIATPIIVSTATTIAAFVPLGAWPGLMGEFMIYFPITLSVVLGSSLIVAIFFNSMLVSQFMKVDENEISNRSLWRLTIILGGLGILLVFNQGIIRGLGTLMLLIPLLFWAYKYIIKGWSRNFQNIFLTKVEANYQRFLRFVLRKYNPIIFLFGTFLLLLFSFVLMGVFPPKVEFFPENQPNQIIVYVEYPEGTSIEKTNQITKQIEEEIYSIVNLPKYNDRDYSFMVETGVTQVGEGAGNPITDQGASNDMPHKARIMLTLREYKFRRGNSSELMRKEIQQAVSGKFPGVAISVEKDANGPPTGYPVTIEIKGDDYTQLIRVAESMKDYLNRVNIQGIEELKIDVNRFKQSDQLIIDRKKAGQLGVSAGQVGFLLRTSLFGSKAGVYKVGGKDYDINVRLDDQYRHDKNLLLNQNVIVKEGPLTRAIPVSSLVDLEESTSFSSIKHRKLDRVVTLYSSVLAGFNGNAVVVQVQDALRNFELPSGVRFNFAGELEDQEENMSFLSAALLMALALILLLLVFQFNSISKPIIILLTILLSFTGVIFGLLIFNMPFVILMTMLGIISLAGIVVNNSVVLIDYTQLLINRRKIQENVSGLLSMSQAKEAVIKGGSARLRPVILTAVTTILGLVPLAIGLNINFFSLVTEWNPKIYVGGDNVVFWGPLAWTVIFGLSFATFLTLVIVPATFTIVYSIKVRVRRIIYILKLRPWIKRVFYQN